MAMGRLLLGPVDSQTVPQHTHEGLPQIQNSLVVPRLEMEY
jgi:hypothetical protein